MKGVVHDLMEVAMGYLRKHGIKILRHKNMKEKTE